MGGSIKLEKLPNYICSDPQDSRFFNCSLVVFKLQ